AIAVHALALVADPWLKTGLSNVLVPFAMPYRPLASALGQVAAAGFLILGPTFYVRRWLGAARWRTAHRWIAAFWALALLHGVTAGTDGATTWYLAATLLVAAPVAVLLALRWSGGVPRLGAQR
ncbi:MAG TPA: hypothetical protein VLA98_04970, partial [Solirubrobacteraceae bacterium]|nr:hypothetical protein [Solirubrobacteraceae bacterium]